MVVKLLFVVNIDWFFISHRLPIAIEAKKRGFDVTLICENTGRKNDIESLGIDFIELPFSRSNRLNPFNEIRYLLFLRMQYKRLKPDIVHHVSIKPILYGTLIIKFLRTKPSVVNAISGMGYLFTGSRKISSELLILPLLRFAFNQKKLIIILQNNDDLSYFLTKNIARKFQLKLIKGSGVDLDLFNYYPIPEIINDSIKILLPSRMLWDKGINEFYLAAKILKPKYPNLLFTLCGDIDVANPSSVATGQLEKWNKEGVVCWIGPQKQMSDIFSKYHIIVLPSYREGLPKSLIEGCAIGRPIITTDAIGCKECVIDGENGFLVPIKDHIKLAAAIEYFIINNEKLSEFGRRSRLKAEKEFDIKQVITNTFDIYEKLLSFA
jgi:glycosyltransferase involved in cell wall biosynthesis